MKKKRILFICGWFNSGLVEELTESDYEVVWLDVNYTDRLTTVASALRTGFDLIILDPIIFTDPDIPALSLMIRESQTTLLILTVMLAGKARLLNLGERLILEQPILPMTLVARVRSILDQNEAET